MRHHRAHRTLGRVKRQRVALLRSLARSLVLHESITTTVAKAKELRPFVERLITESKKNTLASHKAVGSKMGNANDMARKLHALAARYEKRSGGYTRVILLGRVGKRVGEAARIELLK